MERLSLMACLVQNVPSSPSHTLYIRNITVTSLLMQQNVYYRELALTSQEHLTMSTSVWQKTAVFNGS